MNFRVVFQRCFSRISDHLVGWLKILDPSCVKQRKQCSPRNLLHYWGITESYTTCLHCYAHLQLLTSVNKNIQKSQKFQSLIICLFSAYKFDLNLSNVLSHILDTPLSAECYLVLFISFALFHSTSYLIFYSVSP